jgi:hypothetical protein
MLIAFPRRAVPAVLGLALAGCGGGGGSSAVVTTTSTTTGSGTTTTIDETSLGNFLPGQFSVALTSQTRVACTLDDGSAATCYELTFLANGAGDQEGAGSIGPFCPETITVPRDEAGFGVYDGETNPGFQSLIDAFAAMEADGFDIVDEAGNVTINGGPGQPACLAMPIDRTLELVYQIPVTPVPRAVAHELGTVEAIGVGLTGVPYKGNPPGVAVAQAGTPGGNGGIPALDHCGGHVDPAGYYHWHFVPQAMNEVLGSEAYDFTNRFGISCRNFFVDANAPAAYAGLAKDGYPLYGPFDLEGGENLAPETVAELDSCRGHSHETPDFPDGVYHYHARAGEAPNVPTCLTGQYSRSHFSVR